MKKPRIDDYPGEKTTIELGKDKIVVLTLMPFDTDVDMDEFTQIHSHNIFGEIITCSVALNRVGNLLALSDEVVSLTKLDNEIWEAQKKESVRKSLINEKTFGEKVYKPTVDEIESEVKRSPDYKIKQLQIIKVQKNRDIVNSFYWAIKSKDEKLNKLTEKLLPNEFEKQLIEEKINGVMISVKKRAIS